MKRLPPEGALFAELDWIFQVPYLDVLRMEPLLLKEALKCHGLLDGKGETKIYLKY